MASSKGSSQGSLATIPMCCGSVCFFDFATIIIFLCENLKYSLFYFFFCRDAWRMTILRKEYCEHSRFCRYITLSHAFIFCDVICLVIFYVRQLTKRCISVSLCTAYRNLYVNHTFVCLKNCILRRLPFRRSKINEEILSLQ